MKLKFLVAGVMIGLLSVGAVMTFGQVAATSPGKPTPASVHPSSAPDPVADQLQAIVASIQDKLSQGKDTAADLAGETKAIDDLLGKYAGKQNPDAARILFLKALINLNIFKNYDQTHALFTQLKTDYPNTPQGQKAAEALPVIEQQAAALRIQGSLIPGAVFPDFSEKDLQGRPLSVGAYKGKVVLVDFWATWCPLCCAEMPNVISVYKKYHDQGFEVIGISMDDDRTNLDTFLKDQAGMDWPQYFDGKGRDGKLVARYGINGIPFNLLIGPDGKIIGRRLMGDDLAAAVETALKK